MNKTLGFSFLAALKSLSPLFFFYFRRKVEAFTNHNILKRCDFLQSFMFFWDVKCTIYGLLTEQISILRSWVDDVIAATRLQSSA